MQTDLLTDEIVHQQILAGPKWFVFTNKRLIIRGADGPYFSYIGYDMISRPVLTMETLSEDQWLSIKRYSFFSGLALFVLGSIYGVVTGGIDGLLAGTIILYLFGVPVLLVVSLISGFILSKMMLPKPRQVALFQVLLRDGSALVNEWYELDSLSALRQVEFLIVDRTLSRERH